jgi:hypothetical protein
MIQNKSYIITPEYYPRLPATKTKDINTVKALFISERIDVMPQIISDTSNNIIDKLFKNVNPYCLFFNRDYHMYIDTYEQIIGTKINFIATYFARMQSYHHTFRGAGEQICGNVIIFGSKNIDLNLFDNKDHSVPYSLVEESLRIYDIGQKTKSTIY